MCFRRRIGSYAEARRRLDIWPLRIVSSERNVFERFSEIALNSPSRVLLLMALGLGVLRIIGSCF